MTHDYIENIHIGVVNAGGYLDPSLPSLTEEDRQQRSYLQMSNRTRDLIRHDEMRKSYIRGILRRRNSSPVSSRSGEILSGATATVQLSTGEVVEIPVEYVSPIQDDQRPVSLAAVTGSPEREPEPYGDAVSEEPEGEAHVRRESSPVGEESNTTDERTEDADLEGHERAPEMPNNGGDEETTEEKTLSRQIFGPNPDFSKISMRAMMRARLEMNSLQKYMEIAHQSGDTRVVMQLQRAMENVVPFMDAEVEP